MMAPMDHFPNARLLGPGPDPIAVAAAWPAEFPLVSLLSARGGSPFARWSILAPTLPGASHLRVDPGEASGPELHDKLDRLAAPTQLEPVTDPDAPPFRGGRILVLSYELGHDLEPRVTLGADTKAPDARPIAESIDVPIALVHDREQGQWWLVGDADALPGLETFLHCEPSTHLPFQSEPLTPLLDDAQYAALVDRTVEYVHAGDVFQANIARRFVAHADLPLAAQRRDFAAAILAESGAWFGAIIELPRPDRDETIVSLSPELFLTFNPVDRTLRSRPIKGTLPGGADPADLEHSSKDAAELAMIVDLMRNDIGRVAMPGSVHVREARAIELHPGVIHGVADVAGTLRDGVGLGQLLQATFPPGSVTGAPKVRAMQIIHELEPVDRGPYCGAIGFSSACGRLALDVSIRTLLIRPHTKTQHSQTYSHEIQYGAGCGIVAESDPLSEAAESTAKAALFAQFLQKHATNNPTDEDINAHPSREAAELA